MTVEPFSFCDALARNSIFLLGVKISGSANAKISGYAAAM